MDWKDQCGGVLGRYAGINPATMPSTVFEDFSSVVEAAPKPAIAHGLETAFRASETPPLPQMVAELFARSDASQRAGLLNLLVDDLTPSVVRTVFGEERLKGVAGILGRERFLSAGEAANISPEIARELVAAADVRDHAIVEKIVGFYTDYPRLLRALDPTAQGVFLSGLAQIAENTEESI
jgi:hypothetical protein